MAKIIPINQKYIDSCNGVLELVNERFLDMSFQERVEHYQAYLDLKEMFEHLLKRAQGDHDPQDQKEINETKA